MSIDPNLGRTAEYTDEDGQRIVYSEGRISIYGEPSLTAVNGHVAIGVDVPEQWPGPLALPDSRFSSLRDECEATASRLRLAGSEADMAEATGWEGAGRLIAPFGREPKPDRPMEALADLLAAHPGKEARIHASDGPHRRALVEIRDQPGREPWPEGNVVATGESLDEAAALAVAHLLNADTQEAI